MLMKDKGAYSELGLPLEVALHLYMAKHTEFQDAYDVICFNICTVP